MFHVNDLSSELGEVREINIGCRGGEGGGGRLLIGLSGDWRGRIEW